MSDDDRRATVYALADPALVARAQQQIGDAVRLALGVTDAQRYPVTVSPSSGWLSFADRDRVWIKDRPPALPDATRARAVAEDFLRRLTARLTALSDLPGGLPAASLFPPLRPAELSFMPRLDGAGGDHWLYRAQPVLPLGGGLGRADVLGAHVEVRLGDGGRVVGLVSHWRPLSGERVTARFAPFVAPAGGHHGGQGPGEEHQHRTVYVLAGDGVPQYYLAPYHLVDTGHVFALMTAGPWSLTVEFAVQPDPATGAATVTAVVDGGSGNYAFAWARCLLDDPAGIGELIELGSGENRALRAEDDTPYSANSIRVPRGAHLMLLLVKDRRTGAFLHGQHMICTGPFLSAADALVS